jgi:GTPase SAR1 family protein
MGVLMARSAISGGRTWPSIPRKRYRIAVLGARYSGKTTLINSWCGEWVADEADPGRTQSPKFYEKTKLITEGLRVTFTKLVDVSGSIDAWPTWEDRTKASRYVLYLVDARALAGYFARDKTRNWNRLEDDAGLVSGWLREGRVKLCLMVVTHVDQDARLEEYGQGQYRECVMEQLDPLILKLGGPRMVRVVVGSLKRRQDAEEVTSQILREIVSWEKSKNDWHHYAAALRRIRK